MIPVQNIYTGHSAGVVVPDTPKTDRANESFYRQQYEMNTRKLLESQQRQKQFLDFTSVEPIEAIAQQHQLAQAQWIDNFEKEAKKIYTRSLGRPSTMDMMKLQNMKIDLLKKQQALKGNQDIFLQDTSAFIKNPYDWVPDKYFEGREKFFNTGTWDRNSMVPSKPNVISQYSKIPKLSGLEGAETTRSVYKGLDSAGNQVYEYPKFYAKADGTPMTGNDLRDFNRTFILRDRQMLDLAKSDFQTLLETDAKEAERYLDEADVVNKGVITEEEKTNAVLEYALDTMGIPKSDSEYIIGGRSSVRGNPDGGGGSKIAVGDIREVENYQPAKANKGQQGRAMVYPEKMPELRLSAKLFPALKAAGYPDDELVIVKLKGTFPNGETDMDITFQDKVPSWRDPATGKTYSDDLVTKQTDEVGYVNINGKKIFVKSAPPLPRNITISGDLSSTIVEEVDKLVKGFANKYNGFVNGKRSNTSYSKDVEDKIVAFMNKNKLTRDVAIRVLKEKGYIQ